MRNSSTVGLHVRVRFQKKFAVVRNDAAVISMPMFATCQVKMERIILLA